jgi:KUP system potassium uptake protein
MVWHVIHSRALHQRVIALTFVIKPVPWVSADQRVTVQLLAPGFWRAMACYGFMDKMDVPALLQQIKGLSCDINLGDVTYYVGHETVRARADGSGLPRWQEVLYAFMQRNSAQIGEYLHLPRDSVVELGRQIEV